MLEITVSPGPRNNATGRRVQIEPTVEAFKAALDATPTSNESWWSAHVWTGDKRAQAAWQSAAAVMVDLDYVDSAGEHAAPSATAAERLNAEIASLPGALWHPSPRGARIVFPFGAPCTDPALFEQAAAGAGALVERAVRKLGLYVDRAAHAPGFEVDAGALRDRARFMYGPRSLVKGIQRAAEVEIITSTTYRPESLATVYTPEPAPAPKARTAPTPAPVYHDGPTDTLADAVAAYNRDHAREWPRSDADCPVCGHKGCFGRLPSAPDRWACWSTNHDGAGVSGRGGVGVRGDRCWTGDALDIDAHESGRTRAEHLRAEGYLADRPRPARPAREEPPPPGDEDAPPDHSAPDHHSVSPDYSSPDSPPASAPGITADYVTSTKSPRVTASNDDWPEPEPLNGELLPVKPYRSELMPECMRAWVDDVADRSQAPIEYPAAIALVELGAIIGRRCGIRPKRKDPDWLEVPNLWGAIVGPPSQLKSPMAAEMLKPMRRLEAEAFKAFEEVSKEHAFALDVAKAQKEKAKADLKKAIAKGRDVESLREELEKPDPAAPTVKRFIVNDATIEKLGELLNQNQRGLLQFRDEMQGWLASMARDGHENDRGFYLESWNGKNGYTYDRIGRGTIRIESTCVSVLGTTQPGPMREQIRESIKEGAKADGLVQRFQVLVYPDVSRTWTNVDRFSDRSAKTRAWDVIRGLDEIEMSSLGAQLDEESDDIPHLRFSPAGQEIFDTWRHDLENRIRDPSDTSAVVAHLGKYRKLMPAAALVFHLVDCVDKGTAGGGSVSEESALRAVAWCELLESHARRLYSWAACNGEDDAVKALIGRIKAKALTGQFRARDLSRKRWSGLTDREKLESALLTLSDLGWLRAQKERTKGQDTTLYTVNPRALKCA